MWNLSSLVQIWDSEKNRRRYTVLHVWIEWLAVEKIALAFLKYGEEIQSPKIWKSNLFPIQACCIAHPTHRDLHRYSTLPVRYYIGIAPYPWSTILASPQTHRGWYRYFSLTATTVVIIALPNRTACAHFFLLCLCTATWLILVKIGFSHDLIFFFAGQSKFTVTAMNEFIWKKLKIALVVHGFFFLVFFIFSSFFLLYHNNKNKNI